MTRPGDASRGSATDGSSRPVPPADPALALDDFVRGLSPQALGAATGSGDPLADLATLRARLHPGVPPPAAAPAAEDLARAAVPPSQRGRGPRGARLAAADVEDVPLIELPPVPPPTRPGAADIDSALGSAARFAALQLDAEAEAARTPAWQPDLHALRLRAARHPRELASWAPGAWIGASRPVLEAHTEVQQVNGQPVVESHEPMRLLVAWPPQRADAPMTSRWPQRVQLVAADAAQAPQRLLAQLPDDARLWMNPAVEQVDWALAADIALHLDAGLKPHQIEGLRRFIEAERQASFERLNGAYQQAAPGAAILQR